MSNPILTLLRDKNIDKKEFRRLSDLLAEQLASKSIDLVKKTTKEIETPHAKITREVTKDPFIIIILRSALAMLPSFMKFYPNSSVYFFGIYREQTTTNPILYYKKLPETISKDQQVFILDPMLATGKTTSYAVNELKKIGCQEENICLFSMVGAKQGVNFINKSHPKLHLEIVEVDPHLNSKMEIVPGLGDFGDRYFGS